MSKLLKKIIYILFGTALMGVVFAIDRHTPKGVDDGMLYLPVILLTLFVSEVGYTLAAGIVASALICLGYYYSPDTLNNISAGIINRALALASGWVIVILIIVYKRSEKRVLYYKERLSALFEHAEEGILIVTPGEVVTVANPRIWFMFGYTEAELEGKNYHHILPTLRTLDNEKCESDISLDNIASYAGKELLFCAKRNDGSIFPATVHIWSLKFSGSKYFIFFISDVTEKISQKIELDKAHLELLDYSEELRKTNSELDERVSVRTKQLSESVEELENLNYLLQQEIVTREEAVIALNESQTMMEVIAINFPGGMLSILDKNFRFVYARGQDIKNTGYAENELIGRLFMPLENENVSEQIESILIRVFKGGKMSFEYRDPETDNYYLFNAAPLPDADQEISEILVVSQNITMLKQAQEEIKNSLQKEKELNEMKSRFVSTASHEFRTPLAAIVSSASLIGMYNRPDDEMNRKKHVARITASVNNLTDILNDFLSLGKIEEGKVANNPVEFDVEELCEDIDEEVTPLKKSGQKLNKVYCLNTSIACLDKQLLRNVLINLLSNAIKYSPEQAEISLEATRLNGHLKFSVRDTGIGIPLEDQKHLFETFFRASNVENIKGTGMGLNIVKKYLDIMKGSIDFESEVNMGSCFTVTFAN